MKKVLTVFAFLLVLVGLGAVTPTTAHAQTGCSNINSQIPADGAAVSEAVLAIAAVETDSTLKQNLTLAANDLKTATANWKVGTPTDDINTAAIALETVLGSIPQTSKYVTLVPIAVAAIDVLLQNLPATTTEVVKAKTLQVSYNPYRGKATIKHRFGRSVVGDFKSTWNEAASVNLQIR